MMRLVVREALASEVRLEHAVPQFPVAVDRAWLQVALDVGDEVRLPEVWHGERRSGDRRGVYFLYESLEEFDRPASERMMLEINLAEFLGDAFSVAIESDINGAGRQDELSALDLGLRHARHYVALGNNRTVSKVTCQR